MAEYPDSVKIYVMLDKVNWTDISSDVIEKIEGGWGISDNAPTSRLAETGILQFTLKNIDGKYSPNTTTCLTGWGKNAFIKLMVTYQNTEYIRFYGRVSELEINNNLKDYDTVRTTVTDWFDYAAKFPMTGLLSFARRNKLIYQTNQRADEVVQSIIDAMPIAPLATALDEGDNIFPAVFDTLNEKTKAYSEMEKLVQSELGYIYLTKDRTYGETLVLESNQSRKGTNTLSVIPVGRDESDFLITEDGNFLITEDGDYLVLDQTEEPTFDNSFEDIEFDYGTVLNQVGVKAYPKRVDVAPQVIFNLESPYSLGPGETKTFRGTYKDPVASDTKITGMNMQTPVATTDYLMNLYSTGSGTNLTGSLVLTADYGTSDVLFTATNTSNKVGYITKLQCRGYGIYQYNPVEYVAEDETSIGNYGYEVESVDQKYQVEITQGKMFADSVLDEYKNPTVRVRKVTFLANYSVELMNSFLNLDVGSLVHIVETENQIDGYFYIQRVDFSITEGGIVKFSWVLIPQLSLDSGLSPVAIECPWGSGGGINFGYLPHISNLTERTYSMWLNVLSDDERGGEYRVGMGTFSDEAGISIIVQDYGWIYIGRKDVTYAIWRTPPWLWTAGDWHHVVMTMEISSTPRVWFDGVEQALTVITAPQNPADDETGTGFFIGNTVTQTINGTRPADSIIKDARVYNRLLSNDEAIALYNGTNVTDGLVFQGPNVRTNELDEYIDQTLTPAKTVRDNVYGVIGKIFGSPIGRDAS